jgi:hypothetical protein
VARRPFDIEWTLAADRSRGAIEQLRRIGEALQSAGLPFVAMKGPLLAQRVYGDPGLRSFGDLDLLVAPPDADRAEAALAGLGYRPTVPLTAPQVRTLRRFNKERTLTGPHGAFSLDLHWRPGRPMALHASEVIAGREACLGIPTLNTLHTALANAAHAARHGWSRLEMLLAVGGTATWPLDWAALDNLAARAHVSRGVGLGYLLAHEWTGSPLPPLPVCLNAARPVLSWAAAWVSANLAGANRSFHAPFASTWDLYDRRRDSLSGFIRAVFVPTYTDWETASLPPALYWAWRPVRLARKWLPRVAGVRSAGQRSGGR